MTDNSPDLETVTLDGAAAGFDGDEPVDQAGDVEVEEEGEREAPEPVRFNVSSYGWDSDVEGLVKRLDRNDVYTPGFQRGFVWSNPEKSRFIESLILGLPVPTIFLAQDGDSKRLNIVDGQQRLRTLQQYLGGGFALSGKDIQPDLAGRYYSSEVARSSRSKVLVDADARQLADSIIHAVVIKPDPGDNDATRGHEYNRAIIQIFQRLNTSGRPLQHQEIRASIFHGPFDDMLREMNGGENWRALFGPVHSRMKDMEAILRFVALLEEGDDYRGPMPRFLDDFMETNREVGAERSAELTALFQAAIALCREARGDNAFKRAGTFLLSHFDAVMAGVSRAIRSGAALDAAIVEERWSVLDSDAEFQWATSEFVNDTLRVKKRLERATAIFAG
ncbi:DUF262 domain-containing protein [Brevundimonas sp. GCM10030266]|uniref:DUF262 domain-containing protein n=1 Tax=Brevundimonas sp. GCM10030266 TaxID=3273386 RepID=UPI0036099925